MGYPSFTIHEHTADVRVSIYGMTQRELFLNAAQALWHVMEPTYAHHTRTNAIPIGIYARNATHLLVDFLSELVTYADTYHVAYEQITIAELTPYRCIGHIAGYPVDTFTGVEVKGVTHHQAEVTREDTGWHAHIIFDV